MRRIKNRDIVHYYSQFSTGTDISPNVTLDKVGVYSLTIRDIKIHTIYDMEITYVLTKDMIGDDRMVLNKNYIFSNIKAARRRFNELIRKQ